MRANVYFIVLLLSPHLSFALTNFREAKKYLTHHLELFDSRTIYCGCMVTGKTVDLRSCGYKIQSNPKRASRLEWEHVVPAENFGRSFVEWRDGSPNCIKRGKPYRGRKCAETNADFERIEGDLYNLYPEIGELNGLRSNYSMAQIAGPTGKFGSCAVKLQDRKFEPMDSAKGIVARTFLHMDHRYPNRGIVSNKNDKLFEAWDKLYPVTKLECDRWKKIEIVQHERHLFSERCR